MLPGYTALAGARLDGLTTYAGAAADQRAVVESLNDGRWRVVSVNPVVDH